MLKLANIYTYSVNLNLDEFGICVNYKIEIDMTLLSIKSFQCVNPCVHFYVLSNT